MKTLFFSSRDDRNSKTLKASVRETIPESRIEFFLSPDDLEERLRSPVEPDSIAVLSIANREELHRLLQLRALLPEIYVILVLPDRKKSTLALAHLLLPRFLSQREGDFADLKIVLNKMYLKSRPFRREELYSEN